MKDRSQIKVRYKDEDFIYNGFFIPFTVVKRVIEEYYHKLINKENYILDRRFDPVNGKIIRKYTWNVIFSDFIENGKLHKILKSLVQPIIREGY